MIGRALAKNSEQPQSDTDTNNPSDLFIRCVFRCGLATLLQDKSPIRMVSSNGDYENKCNY